jgi:hypothetical protein
LFLRRNRKDTPTNHPTTLTPYHPTTLPPPSSTRTTSNSRAYTFLTTHLPLVPLLCVCFSALDPHSSKSLACVVGCCSPCRRFLQPLEPDPFNTCCCFSVADTRFPCLEPENQPLHICMIPQLWTKRERESERDRETESPVSLPWYQPANPTSSQLRPLALFICGSCALVPAASTPLTALQRVCYIEATPRRERSSTKQNTCITLRPASGSHFSAEHSWWGSAALPSLDQVSNLHDCCSKAVALSLLSRANHLLRIL